MDFLKNPVTTKVVQPPLSAETVAEWRKEFPVLSKVNYLANCSQGPQSRKSRAAIESYLDNWATVGMDWDFWCEEVELAKGEFARLIGASPDEIAVSTSVSEIISSIAGSFLPHGHKRKILTTDAEFPTVGQVWLAHEKWGTQVDYIPLSHGQIDLEEYRKRVDENTLLVSATHVYYQNGFKQDIEAIAEICHSKGVPLLVDAYQSLGTVAIDVKKQKIDMLCCGNLKYLLGVPGLAFLYVDKNLAETLRPSNTGWFGQKNPFDFTPRQLTFAPGSRRFDTGTPPVAAAFASRAGMEIINQVGPAVIEEQIRFLNQVALEEVQRLELPLLSPTDLDWKGAVTAILLDSDSHAMEERLKKMGIVASARGPAIRLAPHFFSLPEELQQGLQAIHQCIHHLA